MTSSIASKSDVLSEIFGQEATLTILRNAVESGRLSGSYLFVGPSGVGKATTALQFAALLCGVELEADPAYRRIVEGVHPDVRVVQPTGKSNTIHVGQLWPRGNNSEHPAERAMLRDLHFEPISAKKRVFIIDGAEGLRGGNEAAGNSILKSLEEPPPYAHFILTGESASSLLPTIVSRCQVVRFGLSPAEEIEAALVARFGVVPEKAKFLSVYSEGRLGHAVVLSRSSEFLAAREDLLNLGERSLTVNPVESFKLAEEFRKLAPRLKPAADLSGGGEGDDKETGARDTQLRALEMLALYYRDLAAVRAGGNRIVNIDRHARLRELAGTTTLPLALSRVETVLGIRTAIERNAHAQLSLEVLFTQLSGMNNTERIAR